MGASAWADVMTTMTGLLGPTDNSNNFAVYKSKALTLAAGDSYTYTFVNYNKGTSGEGEWENWAVEANNGTNYLDFRADGGYWGALPTSPASTGVWSSVSETKTEWLEEYNGVTVTVTVSRSNDGTTFNVAHSATTKTKGEYSGTYTATISASDEITFYLTNEDSHQIITSVVKNGTEFSYASSESAYVDAANAATNYNGASVSNLYIVNTQYRDWGTSDGTMKFNSGGKVSYYKFDLTAIKNKLTADGGTITGATFNVYGISSDNGKDVIKVRVLGYNPEWSSSTITYSGDGTGITNNSGTITGVVTATGSFQPLDDTTERTINTGNTLSENALTYVNSAIAEDKDYVTIALSANTSRAAVLNTYANLTFTYTALVVYEATFTETNSLNPTITVYTDENRTTEIEKNVLEANTTYYYKAVLAGYEDYTGSFTVGTENPSVEFTMTAKTRYTFTLNAVSGETVIKALYTDADSYEGKTYYLTAPAYLTDDNNVVTYVNDNNSSSANEKYGKSYTSTSSTATQTVSFTAYTGEAWFFEGEEIDGATEYTTSTFRGRSSNGSTGVLTAKIIKNLEAGTYKVTARVIGKADKTCSMYKTSTEGDKIFDVTTSTSGAFGVGVITLDAATDIVANGGNYTSSDNGWGFDYILIEKGVSTTVGATGYSTFASSYALDLAHLPSGLTAYYASAVDASSVTLTKATAAVPAETGLILKGTANKAYSIPFAASGTALSGNKLVGCTSEKVLEANESYYVLVSNSGTAEFQSLAEHGATIPAGKAYLNAAAGARLSIVFEDESTGISTIENANILGNGAIYNLNGQRVEKAQKGLYIIDGKKVMMK